MIDNKEKSARTAATVQSAENNYQDKNTTEGAKSKEIERDLREWQMLKMEALLRVSFYCNASEDDKKWLVRAAHEILCGLIEQEREAEIS